MSENRLFSALEAACQYSSRDTARTAASKGDASADEPDLSSEALRKFGAGHARHTFKD